MGTSKKERVSKGLIRAIKAALKDNPKVKASVLGEQLGITAQRVNYVRGKYLGGARVKAAKAPTAKAQKIIIEIRVIRGRT